MSLPYYALLPFLSVWYSTASDELRAVVVERSTFVAEVSRPVRSCVTDVCVSSAGDHFVI